MDTVEALQRAFPQKFPKDEDPQIVTNHILAEQLLEPLLLAVHLSPPIKNIERLNLQLGMQCYAIQEDGNLEKVVEEIKRLCQFGIEQHTDNLYHLLYRLPKEGSARQLLALQIISAGAHSNSPHRHLDQGRLESIFLLQGRYQVNFHNPILQNHDVIVSSRILNPFEGIVIDPRRYHSVKNIGRGESIALILGTPLVDSPIFSR